LGQVFQIRRLTIAIAAASLHLHVQSLGKFYECHGSHEKPTNTNKSKPEYKELVNKLQTALFLVLPQGTTAWRETSLEEVFQEAGREEDLVQRG